MDKKIFVFDVETTGLNPVVNGILTLSCGVARISSTGVLIDPDEWLDLKMQPFEGDRIDQEALDVTGITREQISTFMNPIKAKMKLSKFLEKYIDKYDRADRMTCLGYNVDFDLQFLKEWFIKNEDNYLGSYINWRKVCVYNKAAEIGRAHV